MTIESLGIGLVLSLIFSETLGIATGGMIVPGYIALYIHQPMRVIGTIAVALATLRAIRFLSNYAFIYGRRRTVVVLLISFLFGRISGLLFKGTAGEHIIDFSAIGYIIPGLIADWMERQGVVQTLASLAIAATLTRFLLIIFAGGNLPEFQ